MENNKNLIFKEIVIDFSKINILEEMHNQLKETFGFPEFYGKNVNALIDCWSSLRFPLDGMNELTIDKPNEVVLFKAIKLSSKSLVILNHLIIAIENVNSRNLEIGQTPCILLLPIR